MIINIATVALAVKFRKFFRSTYPGVGKFYDALLLATIVWFIAECFYAQAISLAISAKSSWKNLN
ncbi:hypothetical protein [Thermococcus piezophilus]|uniref:hypothetical protein n=1 Tax=Thermococcus piezophilus TaxID=1712654 RepID=UPI001900D744|nr:hypothetical protein [Thermococcus piezophilus]